MKTRDALNCPYIIINIDDNVFQNKVRVSLNIKRNAKVEQTTAVKGIFKIKNMDENESHKSLKIEYVHQTIDYKKRLNFSESITLPLGSTWSITNQNNVKMANIMIELEIK